MKIALFYMDDVMLDMRFIMQEDKFIDANDPLYAGIHLGNSEVGVRSTFLDAMIFRIMCTNGAIFREGGEAFIDWKHRADVNTSFLETYSEMFLKAADYSASKLQLFSDSKKIYLSDDNSEQVFTKIEGMRLTNKEFADNIASDFDNSREKSLYSLVNAITYRAQELTWPKRLQLERFAGVLLKDMSFN
jgi:hypothetical protein